MHESNIPAELAAPNKRVTPTTGLEGPPDSDNHDPSNVIYHDGLFHLWFTGHREPYCPFRNSFVEYATSADGIAWRRHGIVLEARDAEHWDNGGVLTAFVVPQVDRFYMFYTGVGADFDGAESPRFIGCAVADNPAGPWSRDKDNIVLSPDSAGNWDDGGVDDANIIRQNNQWWLYYKGRRRSSTAAETRIGVAAATDLAGPYRRHPANPLLPGHALTAWKHRDGVAMITGQVGPPVVHWSTDGITFHAAGAFKNQSTGVYNPADFVAAAGPDAVPWGIDVHLPRPRTLFRFDAGRPT